MQRELTCSSSSVRFSPSSLATLFRLLKEILPWEGGRGRGMGCGSQRGEGGGRRGREESGKEVPYITHEVLSSNISPTVSSSSNRRKAFSISSLESFSLWVHSQRGRNTPLLHASELSIQPIPSTIVHVVFRQKYTNTYSSPFLQSSSEETR